jgi:hypothetical protein
MLGLMVRLRMHPTVAKEMYQYCVLIARGQGLKCIEYAHLLTTVSGDSFRWMP